MIKVDIVCPIYNGYDYLPSLFKSFYEQKYVTINKIVFPVTVTNDEQMVKIRKFIEEKGICSFEVLKNDFSHSLTREKAIREFCESDIVIMLSQDVKLVNDMVFYNLTKDIYDKTTVYNYARQVCNNRTIEKYIRKKNYPEVSKIISKEDIEDMQLMAFFASDACSAYERNIFLELDGYNGYDVMMNEDQLYSKIVLDAGYKKKYCSDAIVEHSHKYTLKELYNRYYETGKFYKLVKIFDEYKSTNTGLNLALFVLKKAFVSFDIPVLFRWLPDMAVRYLGMRRGKKD